MNLIVDVGNTAVKIAVFLNEEIIEKRSVSKLDFENNIKRINQEYPEIKTAIISSVAKLNDEQWNAVERRWDTIRLNSETSVPFENTYKTPKTLGVDRIALTAAAVKKFPKKNILIIDAGTCITYDFKNSKDIYIGGGIAPGIQMRYKSLHEFTANLPLLKMEKPQEIIGKTTDEAMHSGIINGVSCEIDGVISYYCNTFNDLTVILTGGDADFLSKRLKNSIFAAPDFLLEGLNHVLVFNKDK